MAKLRDITETKVTPEVQEEVLQGVETTLPSRGVDYPWCEDGKILLRTPKMREVKFISQMNQENHEEMMSRLVGTLLVRPKIDPLDLTISDRNFIFLWSRIQITNLFNMPYICPACDKKIDNYAFELTKVPIKLLDEKYTGPMQLTMPESKKNVTFRLYTARDDKIITKFLSSETEKDEVRAICAQCTTLDGMTSLKDKYEWLGGDCEPMDYMFIQRWFGWTYHGPELDKVPFSCPACKEETDVVLPFRPSLYLPTIYSDNDIGLAICSSKEGDSR